uniref:RPA-interacting protein C-terminal domain-containing protein n=1 Tax=Arcella intermedia TaxID=1963864 RepID=A0A6B2LMB0_9EUKA
MVREKRRKEAKEAKEALIYGGRNEAQLKLLEVKEVMMKQEAVPSCPGEVFLEEFRRGKEDVNRQVEGVILGTGVLKNEVRVECPVCDRGEVYSNQYVLFCECGFRLNTSSSPMSLSQFQHLLQLSREEHQKHCTEKPHYRKSGDFLLLECTTCGEETII